MSELLLYQNKIYQEAQLFEKSIKHLDENKNCILDKLALLEKKGLVKKKFFLDFGTVLFSICSKKNKQKC